MLVALLFLIQIAVIVRVLLRPHRDPAARMAWIVVILVLPVIGVLSYVLIGETNIGRKRTLRVSQVMAQLPKFSQVPGSDVSALTPTLEDRHEPLFIVGQSISGFPPISGNQAQLMADSNATIDAMVDDIDNATDHVHLLFYIWMPDGNGRKMAEAVKRAVARGVACRVLVDDLGSRLLIRSPLWAEMHKAGVKLGRALEVGNPLLRIAKGRIDLRNHRKIAVIDNHITYCGSQNCADPEFLTKAKYAPWVDAVMRFTGPIARQNQKVFVGDWMANVDEDIRDILLAPLPPPQPGFTAQVIASGPTMRHSAATEMFESLIYNARRELIITTPYYVPVRSLQSALCAAANRNVQTTLILPARNDDFAVAATSRSYYEDLLDAGVRIFEFLPGLLHTKSLTLDQEITLIGSANMDRRSFELNYENNILFHDPALTNAMRTRQHSYLTQSREVTAAEVADWSRMKRLRNNALAIVGPLL